MDGFKGGQQDLTFNFGFNQKPVELLSSEPVVISEAVEVDKYC